MTATFNPPSAGAAPPAAPPIPPSTAPPAGATPPGPAAPAAAPAATPATPATAATPTPPPPPPAATPAPAEPAGPGRMQRAGGAIMDLGSFLLYPGMVLLVILLYNMFKNNEGMLGNLVAIVVALGLATMLWFVHRDIEAARAAVPPPHDPAPVRQMDLSGHWWQWDDAASQWQLWDGTNWINLS